MDREFADLLGLLSGPLRAGVAPTVAAEAALAALGQEVLLRRPLEDVVAAAAMGRSLAAVWLHHATRLDSPALRFVGQAWAMTERTGAPLAEALACAEAVLRQHERTRERLASAAAGPRASMAVLCALPATGPLVGLAVGMSPRELYLASPVSRASVALGVVLAVVAWAWSRRILAGALAPTAPGRRRGRRRGSGPRR